MADAIMMVLREFNLVEKTLALTTNNASSMIFCDTSIAEELEREFNNLNFAHYRCAVHIFNLAVTQGIKLINESVEK
ncbi:12318_t:CDS:1, partial [Ambispora gerdemannii]